MKEVELEKRSIGLNFTDKEECELMVWSPESDSVHLLLNDKKIKLDKDDSGYWSLQTDQLRPGTLYKIVLNGENEFPDPASLSQPEGVHAASMAVDLKKFKWTDHQWKNHQPEDYILYELHTG